MTATVLFDAPGPKARRNTAIGTVIALLALVGVVVLALVQLAANDQLDPEKWGPLFNPGNRFFVATWSALGQGLALTLVAAALTLVFSMVVGTTLAVIRISKFRVISWLVSSALSLLCRLPVVGNVIVRFLNFVIRARDWAALLLLRLLHRMRLVDISTVRQTPSERPNWLVIGFIELLRGLPVVITIFFAARVLPELGLSLPPLWYLVIGLTAYNCVIIAEIIRSGVQALPKGQSEAAYAVGLTRFQVLRLILLPQAFRIMLPALISQLVVIVKDTSLGFVIFNFSEFVRTARIVIQFFGGSEGINLPLQMFVAVALVFILINYGLGKLAEYVERRSSRSGRAAGKAPVTVNVDGGGGAGVA